MTMSDDVCGVGQNVSRECWDMLRHVCRWVLKKEKRSDIGSFFIILFLHFYKLCVLIYICHSSSPYSFECPLISLCLSSGLHPPTWSTSRTCASGVLDPPSNVKYGMQRGIPSKNGPAKSSPIAASTAYAYTPKARS